MTMTTTASKKLDITRGAIYLACFAGSALALAGMAEFDSATGVLDIGPFNLYAATGAVAGIVSSALAFFAVMFRWGK